MGGSAYKGSVRYKWPGGLVVAPVGMRGHELWHPQQLQEIWFQALPQGDGSRQLQQEPQALQAEQTEHHSLQDLTGFCKYLIG